MTPTRSSRRPTPYGRPGGGPNRQMLLVGGAVLLVVVVLGLVIAFGPGDTERDSDALDFGPVRVEGTTLAEYASGVADPAEGSSAPRLFGQDPAGTPVAMEGREPTLLVFLAHWCPHCQAELPVLVEMASQGEFDGVRTLAVLTGTNPDAPNYPPAGWLEREGWTGDVLVDNDTSSAAAAYGLSTYPYLVALDATGTVVARASGEMPAAEVAALVALATGS